MSRETHEQINRECKEFARSVHGQFNGKRLPAAIEGHLRTLRELGDRLLLTWSDMAGRNLLNDMLRAVRQLESQLKGRPRAAAIALQQRLEHELAGHALTRARYNSVVCLGYKVQTTDFKRYQGIVDDYEDLRAKCQDMIEAIRAARGLVSAAEQTNTRMLKIFMAPEFFFRGANGGYDYDVVLGLGDGRAGDGRTPAGRQGLLGIMQEEIGNPIYKDWLFVLGTVVAVSQHTQLVCRSCKVGVGMGIVGGVNKPVCQGNPKHVLEEEVGAWADNIAYVCKGSEVHTVSKELIADLDFVADRNRPRHVRVRGEWTPVQQHEHRIGIRSTSKEATRFQDERMGGCIFTLDGVTFGLEVCMDHAYSRHAGRSGRLDHAGNIQIQLIPSAGIYIKHLRTIPGGVVFNVDAFPAVRVVGRSKGRVRVFNSDEHDQMLQFKRWQPQPMLTALEPDDSNGSTAAWRAPSDVRIAPAPRGSIVGQGPFEIPRACPQPRAWLPFRSRY